MNSLEEVAVFYNSTTIPNKHEVLYKTFEQNARQYRDGSLVQLYNNTPGFGDIAFSWSWHLLVNAMPTNFNFLEIGVYKGRVLATIQLVSNLLQKSNKIVGVTPLNTSNDKYSTYEDSDYLEEIKRSFLKSNLSFDNTTIIKGFSQENDIIAAASAHGEYDIIFIDGCHDYDIVCLDIMNYTKMLKRGGYLVIDDSSSLFIKESFGAFLGHNDVGRAVQDILDQDKNFSHIYAVSHNRVWKKL